MKLPRPYIPLSVRILVAYRMCNSTGTMPIFPRRILQDNKLSSKKKLSTLLEALFFKNKVQLDHEPALMFRREIIHNGKHVGYDPPANHPDFLIYRKAEDHKIKTLIRGDGAQRSDFAQRRYLKRVAENRKPKTKFKPRRAKQIRRVK